MPLCISLMVIADSVMETRRERHWRQANSGNLGGASFPGCVNLGSHGGSQETCLTRKVSGAVWETVGFLESGGLAVCLWLFSDKPLNCVKFNFLTHKIGASEIEVWQSFSECSENLPLGYGPYKMFLIFFYPCVTGAKVVFHLNSSASNLFSSSFYPSIFCLLA